MKILIASDSFKGTITSLEAADYIEKGIRKVFPDSINHKIAVADGGEGTVEAILENSGGDLISVDVTGPQGNRVTASYGILKDKTAIIEMASASGLPLVPENRRNPLLMTTKGTGELILSALDRGCRKIIIGLGGSATNDGGVGMAQALGIGFKDKQGNELNSGGGSLQNLSTIDLAGSDKRLKQTEIIIASDVTNPLLGKNGASYVYGPQKGADPHMVDLLDKNLQHLNSIAEDQLKLKLAETAGAGAAGGLGYGLLAFCNAQIQSGIEILLDTIEFNTLLPGTDMVITGEGRIDGQSINGKVPVGIAGRAKKYNIPVLVIAGGMEGNFEAVYDYGIDSIMSTVNRAMALKEAMNKGPALLIDAAERAMRMIKMGMGIKKV